MANVEGKIGTTSSVRTAATGEQKRRGGLLRDRRLYWFAGALVVLALSTYVACVQPLRPDPYHDPSLFSAEWFLYPIERNAPKRLSRASTPINDVGPVPGTDRVWLVGDGCLVMRSEDRGRTWRMDSTILRMMTTTDYPSTQTLSPDSAGRSTNRSALPQTTMMISPWGAVRRWAGSAMPEYSSESESGPLRQDSPGQYPPEVDKGGTNNPLMNDPGNDPKKDPGTKDTTGPVRQPVQANTVSVPASSGKRGGNRGPAKPTPAPVDTNHDRAGQTIVPSSGRSIPDLMSVMFVDERVGWICGSGGVILKTTDGGSSWGRITVDSRQGTLVTTDTTAGAIRSKGPVTSTQSGLVAVMLPPAPQLEAIDERTVFVRLALPNGSDLEWAWRYATDGGTTWNVADPVFPTVGGIGEWTVAHNGDILQMSANGSSWVAIDSAFSPLSAVHGIGDRIAGVVGIGGTLLRTTDGGRSWVNVALPRRQGLTDIRFDTHGNGWIVGRGGALFITADSGATWSEGGLPLGTDARRVKVSDDGDVWVVGQENIVLRSTDRGQNWGLCVAYDERASSIQFVDSRHGFIGAARYIAETRNGGERWKKIPLPLGITSRSVQFVDGSTGWMIDRDRNLYKTTDAGMSWSAVSVRNDTLSAAVYFIDARQGWHLGRRGISFTSDGGATWAKRWAVPVWDTLTEPEFYGDYLYFADTSHGWLSGFHGRFLRTTNGGVSWEQVSGGDTMAVSDIISGSSSFDVAVGWSGLLLRSDDSGASWEQVAVPVRSSLFGVDSVDRVHGCAVGGYGTVLTTSNGGSDWTLRPVPIGDDLTDVAYADSLNVWAVAAGGTTLHSLDGGVTWAAPVYVAYPAPWYYFSLAVALLMFIPALRRPLPTVPPEKTVADLLISDSPVDSPLHDSMNLGSIAEGLSLFIRNEHTMPPLTIAVTGEWGSGKSSLMNLLRGDLVRNGFRPVWFNAWHHQKEEHLLAALLQNIRQQAVAPIWHPTGISFRLRLLLSRWRRFAPMIIILLTLFAVSLGYFMRHPASMTRAQEKFSMVASHVESLFSKPSDTVSTTTLSSKDSLVFPSFEKTGFFAMLVSSLGGLFLLTTRGLVAFGMTPAVLLNSARKNASVRDLQAQTSFRHTFATEFREVTGALHPRSMVILIDDLDRCRPQNLLDLLEAVNFLVTSGDCYIIMGMDMSRIEQFVTAHYAGTSEADFARKYLEKLINIEVPIPRPNPDQARTMLMPPVEIPDARYIASLGSNRSARIRRPYRKVFLAAALFVSVFAITYMMTPEQVLNPVPATVAETSSNGGDEAPVSGNPASSEGKTGGGTEVVAKTSQETEPVRNAAITPGAEPSLPIDLLLIPLIILLGIGIVRLSKRPDVIVRDSEDFTDALAIWSSIIVEAHRTPRSLKRFMNRIRYFAMQQRPVRKRERRWWRVRLEWLPWLRGKQQAPSPPPPSRAITEEKIVALHTLLRLKPIDRWDDDLFKGVLPEGYDPGGRQWVPDPGNGFLTTIIAEHIARFGDWPPTPEDIESFKRLMEGVRISV